MLPGASGKRARLSSVLGKGTQGQGVPFSAEWLPTLGERGWQKMEGWRLELSGDGEGELATWALGGSTANLLSLRGWLWSVPHLSQLWCPHLARGHPFQCAGQAGPPRHALRDSSGRPWVMPFLPWMLAYATTLTSELGGDTSHGSTAPSATCPCIPQALVAMQAVTHEVHLGVPATVAQWSTP